MFILMYRVSDQTSAYSTSVTEQPTYKIKIVGCDTKVQKINIYCHPNPEPLTIYCHLNPEPVAIFISILTPLGWLGIALIVFQVLYLLFVVVLDFEYHLIRLHLVFYFLHYFFLLFLA